MAKRTVKIAYLPEVEKVEVEVTLKRKHLRMVHPFLSQSFRTLKKSELKSKKVFEELFKDEKFEAWKLKAIYEYQL